jgi:riboflavin transporter FmnP
MKGKMMKTKTRSSLRYMAKIGVLTAMAFVLMLLEFPLPFLAPPFYKLDFSEIAVLMGSFALGPMAGVLIELLKNLLNLIFEGTTTNFVGEFANFVTGCAFVLPAAFLYRYRKSIKGALVGLAIGTLTLGVFGALLNYFFLIPAFSQIYGLPLETIIGMGTAVNPLIGDLRTLVVIAVLPFNIVKGLACSLVTFLLYKHVSPILHK